MAAGRELDLDLTARGRPYIPGTSGRDIVIAVSNDGMPRVKARVPVCTIRRFELYRYCTSFRCRLVMPVRCVG